MEELRYTITCTAAPVQAEGTICGKSFYFRSRHEHWSFSVSENPDVDPADIIQDSPYGFFIEEEYGDRPFAASYMPLNEAEQIIQRCVELYLQTIAIKPPLQTT